MEDQDRDALRVLQAKLFSLSEDEWRILEMVEQSGGIGIHVESMYAELWLGPAYISDVLRVLERNGLVKIDRGYNYLSDDIRNILGGHGNLKLRNLLDIK